MIKTDEGRVTLADVINIERQPANPQRLALVCYTPEGKMHIVPIVNYYQRTDEELAEDPTSTVDAYIWFMRKDDITLRALPEGFIISYGELNWLLIVNITRHPQTTPSPYGELLPVCNG